MTVQATPNFISYVGDNIQTSFNFTFRADDVSWVSVDFLTSFDQILLNVDQDTTPGGSAEYLVAPPALQDLTITRATPITQEQDYTRYDPFDSESNENSLDKLTMEIQDLGDTLSNLIGAGTVQGSILRFDLTGPISGYVEFGPGVGEFLLPAGDGAPGQALITDGLGQLSFANFNPGTVLAGSVVNSTLRWTGVNWAEFLTYLFPALDGAAGEVLSTDGLGQLSFIPFAPTADSLQAVCDVGDTTTTDINLVASHLNLDDTGEVRFGTLAGGEINIRFDSDQTLQIYDASAVNTAVQIGPNINTFMVNAEENAGSIVQIGESITLRGDSQIGRLNIYGEDTGVLNLFSILNTGTVVQFVSALTNLQFDAVGNDIVFNCDRLQFEAYQLGATQFTIVANAVTIDALAANFCFVDIDDATANFAVTLINPALSGTYGEVTIQFVQGVPAFQPTWPASVQWPNSGVAPVLGLVDNETNVVHLWTRDAGSNWYGSFLTDYA